MSTTTNINNAAVNNQQINTLTAASYWELWELWQLERYGNILPEHKPLVNYDEDDYQQNYIL